MTHKDILLLVNVTATDEVYPTIIQYAREHDWRLAIEDRMAPPANWHGDGALVQAMDFPASTRYLNALRRRGIAVVSLTNTRSNAGFSVCSLDIRKGATLAAGHLAQCGFVHAAYFSMEWNYGREMHSNAFACAWNGNFRCWIWPLEASRRHLNDRSAMVRWLKAKLSESPHPIAIFTPNSYNALVALNTCLDLGMAVPEDAAILSGCYDSAFCDCQAVPISGVEYDTRLHAMEGAALLDRLVGSKQRASERILIPPSRLVVQQSTDVLATDDPLLRQALRFIRENIARPFGAAEIADRLAVPRIRLDRCFAAALRRSAGSEIARQRIECAKRLLADTNMTLNAIASECGFCHASHLINTFKRKTGMTPHRFRNARA